MRNAKRPVWLELLLTILLPVLGMALGVGTVFVLGLNQTDYSNLVINLCYFAGVIGIIRLFKISADDLGLKIIKEQIKRHLIFSLAIFAFYMLFYIFVIRISSLKTFSMSTFWGLGTYIVVVFAEELYFRGALFSLIEKRYSAKTALIVTSILFGLFHGQQGFGVMLARIFTGWLWGSIRYSTRMIFLIIFPIHFAYNTIWLLFEGNWNNPPSWAVYTLPLLELLLGLGIVLLNKPFTPDQTQVDAMEDAAT